MSHMSFFYIVRISVFVPEKKTSALVQVLDSSVKNKMHNYFHVNESGLEFVKENIFG